MANVAVKRGLNADQTAVKQVLQGKWMPVFCTFRLAAKIGKKCNGGRNGGSFGGCFLWVISPFMRKNEGLKYPLYA